MISEPRRTPLLLPRRWVNNGRNGRLTSPPLAGGWSRKPIGCGDPLNDEVEGHRHQLGGSEESRHQNERKDGSAYC